MAAALCFLDSVEPKYMDIELLQQTLHGPCVHPDRELKIIFDQDMKEP